MSTTSTSRPFPDQKGTAVAGPVGRQLAPTLVIAAIVGGALGAICVVRAYAFRPSLTLEMDRIAPAEIRVRVLRQ